MLLISSPVSFLMVALLACAVPLRPASAFTADEAKAAMTVTLVRSDAPGCGADCPQWLQLTGRIGFETPRILAAALARLKGRKVPILLDSPGGESLGGLAMGRMIRAHRLDTAVGGTVVAGCAKGDAACLSGLRAGLNPGHIGTATPACASACVFVLAGGMDRAVSPTAYVGVHQAMRVLTYHPVINTFQVLSRRVGSRVVEVSRTLVATRALPVRVVKGAAPESLYSELDRYLLGMGIDDSIMPLMRATPPSGIHWMSQIEMGATHLSTDMADAETLVSREAASQAAAARQVRLPAALTLGDGRRWKGVVSWRIDATSPGLPTLVGEWDLPERRLRGSVAISADPAPGTTASFRVLARFASEAGPEAATVMTIRSPQLCDLSQCSNVITGEAVSGRSAAAFDVIRDWRAAFLINLRQRDWLSFDVRTDDGWGSIALTLASPDENAVTVWEKLCCAFAATDFPWYAPATSLPALPAAPEPFIVAGIRPIDPARGAKPDGAGFSERSCSPCRDGDAGSRGSSHGTPPRPSPRTLDVPALFDAAPARQHGFPLSVHGSMTWFPLATPASVGGPGRTALLGSAELPAAGLRVAIEAGASKPGVLGRLTFRLHNLTENPAVFGPVTRIVAMNSFDVQGHPMLLPNAVTEFSSGGGDEILLDVPESGPIAGAVQVGFQDTTGRRVTLAFPFDSAVAALLQAASRKEVAGGS